MKAQKTNDIKYEAEVISSPFLLQAGHPTAIPLHQKNFTRVSEIFPLLFSENDESAFFFWQGIPVRLHYTYELYANFDRLLEWWEKLVREPVGTYGMVMLTDIFIITFKAAWKNGAIKILAEWKARRSHGPLAGILNEKEPVVMPVRDFLREWKIVMYQIVNSVKKTGISLTDPGEKEKIQRLIRIVNAIEGQGKLYTSEHAV